MKCLSALTLFSFLVLSAAAIWMGALNQDEGWYLYAAQLVAEGQMPYRDFFYTQGPLLPLAYSAFAGVWQYAGLLGARIMTWAIGAAGLLFAAALAWRFAPEGRKKLAAWLTFVLLGCNLYHVYYLTIPKTYALASLFVLLGFWMYSCAGRFRPLFLFAAGLSLSFAAGARISLGALLAVVGLLLLLQREWRLAFCFALGGFLGLGLVYGPFLIDEQARAGLLAAQRYHAARGGSDIVWFVGSISRLVRWYLPVFLLLGLGDFRSVRVLLVAFAVVFGIQMLAPFPYEDYQVPVISLVAVFAVVNFLHRERPQAMLMAVGLCCACSLGSPLLEKWSTNGQDRFWSVKKEKFELAQLRDVAARIEQLDPGGSDLLTQDLYLAIETRRKVPKGLEMGPFSMLTDDAWRELLSSAPCALAALSGYSFAIEPPVCNMRATAQQIEYFKLLKKRYELVDQVAAFGQNATTLLLLKRSK